MGGLYRRISAWLAKTGYLEPFENILNVVGIISITIFCIIGVFVIMNDRKKAAEKGQNDK